MCEKKGQPFGWPFFYNLNSELYKKDFKIGQIVFIQTTTPPSTFKTAPVI